jgi:D-alanine transfer protein
MKELKKLVIALFSVIIIFIIGGFLYNKYLDKELSKTYIQSISAVNGTAEKDKGIALQGIGVEKNNFMLYGSSELSSPVPQNPSRVFPNKENTFLVNLVGRGHDQNLQHSINYGALGDKLNSKKIGLVVSLQWFLDESGIPDDSFQMNFSELQFYRFLNNKNIDEATKKHVAERVYKLTKSIGISKSIHSLYAYFYSRENKVLRLGNYVLKPYFYFRQYYLETKDKARALAYFKNNKLAPLEGKPSKTVDWLNEAKLAEEMGKKVVTNNNYFVEDSYFDQYLRPNMDMFKNLYKDLNLLESYEFEDYEKMLQVCTQLNIKPYIILMPVNGYFYDYMGLPAEKREAFYSKVEDLAKKYNFEVLNMKEKEYEPYFFTDIMHLGWKGWLYVDEKIAEYNKTN